MPGTRHALQASGGGAGELRALREHTFTPEAARRGWLLQRLRAAKARAKYALRRRGA